MVEELWKFFVVLNDLVMEKLLEFLCIKRILEKKVEKLMKENVEMCKKFGFEVLFGFMILIRLFLVIV